MASAHGASGSTSQIIPPSPTSLSLSQATLSSEDVDDDEEEEGEIADSDEDDKQSTRSTIVESDAEKEYKLWERLLKEACEIANDNQAQSFQELLEPPHFERFIKHLRETVYHYVDTADQLKYNSDLFEEIKNTIDHLEDKRGYDPEEAILAGWERRKFLVKRLLEQHKEEVEESLFAEDSDNEEIGEI